MDWQELAQEDRLAALREAAADELLALVRAHAASFDLAAARQVLRNPFALAEVLEELAGTRSLVALYEVRRGIAFHARAPEVLALRFVPGLYWQDLVELGLEIRARPAVRRAADRYLIERLPGMSEGEKVSLARRVSSGVMEHLRLDPSRRVIGALLENPRLTESLLVPLVRRQTALPGVLALIAENARWGPRYELRAGLARNPATPVEVALRILPHLRKLELKAVAATERISSVVRRRARLLLGES